ncbi:MAG: hypothetical protein Q7S28_03410 [bacterium]|nr:hypothetical protein [bacterium]
MKIGYRNIRRALEDFGAELPSPEDRRDWEDTLCKTHSEVYEFLKAEMASAASDAAHGDRESTAFAEELIALKDLSTLIFAPVFYSWGERWPTLHVKTFRDFANRYSEDRSLLMLVRGMDIMSAGWGDIFNAHVSSYRPCGISENKEWQGLSPEGQKVLLTTGQALLAQISSMETDFAEEFARVPTIYNYPSNNAEDNEAVEDFRRTTNMNGYSHSTDGALAFSSLREPKTRRASIGGGSNAKILEFRRPQK